MSRCPSSGRGSGRGPWERRLRAKEGMSDVGKGAEAAIFTRREGRKKFYNPKYKEITKSEFYLGSRSNFKEVVEFSNDLISKLNFIEKYCLEVEKILKNEEEREADVKLQDN